MIGSYRDFFVASASASAAFIGLLFVAVSFINSETVNKATQRWRRVIANSAFAQLINVFFVSIACLLPGARDFALAGIIMATLGIFVAFKLLVPTLDGARNGHRSPTVIGLLAVGAYMLQLVTSIGLLNNPHNNIFMSYFVLAIIILYAGALARAWEITDVTRR